jgi:hypothetical protein
VPSHSSARPPLPKSGVEAAQVGGASGSATGAPAECLATERLASIEIPPSPESVKVTVSYNPGSGQLVIKVSRPSRTAPVPADGSDPADAEAGSRCEFRKKGDLWEVVFNGGDPFYLEDTLGARYLDYLLHHPNVLITAFELEVLVTPEKGEARSIESIQPESDSRAKRDYRKALRPLQAQRRCAKKAGDQARVRDLDLEIKKLNAALNKRGGLADTGERARSNVRHAVRLVVEPLERWRSGGEGVCRAPAGLLEHRARVPVQPAAGASLGLSVCPLVVCHRALGGENTQIGHFGCPP